MLQQIQPRFLSVHLLAPNHHLLYKDIGSVAESQRLYSKLCFISGRGDSIVNYRIPSLILMWSTDLFHFLRLAVLTQDVDMPRAWLCAREVYAQ